MANGDKPGLEMKPEGGKKTGIDLAVSTITLATALIGFASAGFLLYNQSSELERQSNAISRLEKSFQNINTLRESLRMPLEGIWSFTLNYTRYNNVAANKIPGGAPYMKGKAGFLWQVTSGESYKYKGYFGAGIYHNSGDSAFVTVFSENTIIADQTGVPSENFKIHGDYVSRTALPPAAPNPPKKDYEYVDCKTTPGPNGKPNIIACKYHSDKSDADVTFTRE